MTVTNPQHPLVLAYLDDLQRALVGVDARERADILVSVREHLAEALPGSASDADVRRVLAELGPVDVIASAATPDADAAVPPRGDEGDSLAVVSAGAAVVGALLLVPLPLVGVPFALFALVTAAVHLRRSWRARRIAWAALLLAASTLLAAAVMAFTLLPAGGDAEPVPEVVQSGGQS